MKFFKEIVDKFSSKKEINLNFENDLKKFHIEKNFIYPFCKKNLNLLKDFDIKEINKKFIFFNGINLSNKSIFNSLEIKENTVELIYPKSLKIKNILSNYLTLIGFVYANSLRFNIEADTIYSSNILRLIEKYRLDDYLNISEFLLSIPWIDNIKIYDNKTIDIFIEDENDLNYIYIIIEKNIKYIVAKNKYEYLLVDFVNLKIKIGREIKY